MILQKPSSFAGLFAVVFLLSCGELIPADPVKTLYRENLSIESNTGEKHHFHVELADSPEERSMGLMYRKEMGADEGMLFLYSQQQYVTMWMHNTFLPLDMIFISSDGKVMNIVERTVPQSKTTISSGMAVIAVLELNAGTVSKHGIRLGDQVNHAFFGKME